MGWSCRQSRAKALFPDADAADGPQSMTTRTLLSYLIALALLPQFLAISAGAHGLVVCVGQGGHVAIEDHEAARRCRDSSAGIGVDSSSGSLIVNGPAAVCVDTPLVGSADQLVTSIARSHGEILIAAPSNELGLRSAPLVGHVPRTLPAPAASSRLLRGVVLLI